MIVTNLRLRGRVQPGIDLGAMLAVFQVDFKVSERLSRSGGIVLEVIVSYQYKCEDNPSTKRIPFRGNLSI